METGSASAPISETGRTAVARATRRLIPFLVLIYFFNFLDRVNIGYAGLTMNKELGLSSTAFGLGAGLFFIGYLIFEVPSNLLMKRLGAKIWISRIMITWGIASACTAFVSNATQFFLARFLLGFAEAGLFPGVILYLTYWFPAQRRARVTALFLLAIPLSSVAGSPLSTAILQYTHGWFGLAGWRVMFLVEGIPAALLGVVAFFVLTNRPAEAKWLRPAEREWLTTRIAAETADALDKQTTTVWRALSDIRIVALSVAYFGIVYGVYALSFFLPTLVSGLAKDFGTTFSFMQVGLLSAIPFAFGGVATWWFGRRSDLTGKRVAHTAVPCFIGAAGLIIAVLADSSPYILMGGLVTLAIGVFGAIPSFWSLPPILLAGAALAAGIGLINAAGNFSGFVGPYVTGWLKDATGDFHAGLVLVAVAIALAGLIALALRRRTGDAEHAPISAGAQVAVDSE